MSPISITERMDHVEKSMDEIMAQLRRVDTHLIPALGDFLDDYRYHLDAVNIKPKAPDIQTPPSPTSVPPTPPTPISPPRNAIPAPHRDHSVRRDWPPLVGSPPSRTISPSPDIPSSPLSPRPKPNPIPTFKHLPPPPPSYLHPITNYHHNITLYQTPPFPHNHTQHDTAHTEWPEPGWRMDYPPPISTTHHPPYIPQALATTTTCPVPFSHRYPTPTPFHGPLLFEYTEEWHLATPIYHPPRHDHHPHRYHPWHNAHRRGNRTSTTQHWDVDDVLLHASKTLHDRGLSPLDRHQPTQTYDDELHSFVPSLAGKAVLTPGVIDKVPARGTRKTDQEAREVRRARRQRARARRALKRAKERALAQKAEEIEPPWRMD